MTPKLSALVTRPKAQAQALIALLNQNGIETIALPAVEIKFFDQVAPCSQSDIAIFTSVNAVVGYFKLHARLDSSRTLAVGEATALALKKQGVTSVITPSDASSEGLLALAELNTVKTKTVLIVTGVGGRNILSKELTKRGANCHRCEVYKRNVPEALSEKLELVLSRHIDYLIVTSGEGLQNLFNANPRIVSIKLVVISQRMVGLAHTLGFRGPILVASGASDQALCHAILEDKND